jgi:hypothetical protein
VKVRGLEDAGFRFASNVVVQIKSSTPLPHVSTQLLNAPCGSYPAIKINPYRHHPSGCFSDRNLVAPMEGQPLQRCPQEGTRRKSQHTVGSILPGSLAMSLSPLWSPLICHCTFVLPSHSSAPQHPTSIPRTINPCRIFQ